ncbi:MAG: hypothetical protein RR388_09180, partial [Rikenellaceae bacterium]
MKSSISRKDVLKTTAIGAVGAASVLSVPAFISSCAGGATKATAENTPIREAIIPELLPKAVDGKPLRAAIIGCGGRGTGAGENFIAAGDGLTIVALADVFQDKLDACRKFLAEKGQTITDDMCFVGFDAYQKVMATDVDLVILTTPPYF